MMWLTLLGPQNGCRQYVDASNQEAVILEEQKRSGGFVSAAHSEYVLGRSQREYARLARQAELFKPMTRRLFEDAGIAPRMRVLGEAIYYGVVS